VTGDRFQDPPTSSAVPKPYHGVNNIIDQQDKYYGVYIIVFFWNLFESAIFFFFFSSVLVGDIYSFTAADFCWMKIEIIIIIIIIIIMTSLPGNI
jgi:hypothetical protein